MRRDFSFLILFVGLFLATSVGASLPRQPQVPPSYASALASVGTQVTAGGASGTPVTSTAPVTFGHAGYEGYLPGALDDVRLYNRVLDTTEIAGLTPQLKRRYTYGLDLISQTQFPTLNPQLSTYYYGYDGHGSVRMLLSSASGASTQITDWYDYDAYGQLLATDGTTVNHYRYTGEQWDNDLGMYYLRARYLNPNTGRFWTMDSYEGSPSDPLSLHKYLYAGDDPVNRIDPSGHKFTPLEAAAIGREVHKRVGQHFLATTPPGQIRVTAQSVFTMLGLPNPPSGGAINGISMLFPDLVDLTHKQVYEIKPLSVGGVARGIVQLTGYLTALNTLDPTGGWGVAIAAEHYNSFNVFMMAKPLAVVTVMPPVLGMIYYEAVTPTKFVMKRAANVAIANSARLQQHMGIATLLGMLGGI